jgi:hypothetical protein
MQANPAHRVALINTSVNYLLAGDAPRGQLILEIARQRYPQDFVILLWLAEAFFRNNEIVRGFRILDLLFDNYPPSRLGKDLAKFKRGRFMEGQSIKPEDELLLFKKISAKYRGYVRTVGTLNLLL